MPGNILSARDIAVNKTDNVCPHGTYIYVGMTDQTQINNEGGEGNKHSHEIRSSEQG